MAGEFAQPLPESWEVRRLDEVATIIDSLHKTPSYSDVGSPMVRVTDVQGGFLDLSKSLHVSDEVFQEFTRRYAPKKGDMVFSRVGSYGNVSYARTDTPFCLGQNTALISPSINGRFLHLFLQSVEARRQIEQVVVGSTQKTISLKSISALQIPIPPPDELEAIAAVLGALDDKIELNRRMNATLEAMARALFQSWFVDFNPVRAKLDGRPPIGMDATTAALFPESFIHDGDLACPTGWRRSPVTEEISLTRGIEPGRDACNSDRIGKRFIRVGDVTGKRESDLYTSIETEVDVKVGEILVSFDGTIGAVSYLSEGIFSSGLRKLEGIRAKIHPCYLWCLAKSDEFQCTINEYAIGTTILHASAAIPHLRQVVSSPEVMNAFDSIVDPIWKQMLNLHSESRTLANLRDTLLPKLLSGELRIN